MDYPIKSGQTFTIGFVKLLSSHPIHIVVWGNFPFKIFLDINNPVDIRLIKFNHKCMRNRPNIPKYKRREV